MQILEEEAYIFECYSQHFEINNYIDVLNRIEPRVFCFIIYHLEGLLIEEKDNTDINLYVMLSVG